MRRLLLKLTFILLGGGERDMAVVYATLIINGRRDFASVPDTLKAAVREVLIDLDLEALAG